MFIIQFGALKSDNVIAGQKDLISFSEMCQGWAYAAINAKNELSKGH